MIIEKLKHERKTVLKIIMLKNKDTIYKKNSIRNHIHYYNIYKKIQLISQLAF